MKAFVVTMTATWVVLLCFVAAVTICQRFDYGKVTLVWLRLLVFCVLVGFLNVTMIFPLVQFFGPYDSDPSWATSGAVVGIGSGALLFFSLKRRRQLRREHGE